MADAHHPADRRRGDATAARHGIPPGPVRVPVDRRLLRLTTAGEVLVDLAPVGAVRLARR